MLIITALYASLLALIVLWLCYKVVVFRRLKGVDIGDNGNELGQRHIRAQQNAVEYIPLVLVLFAVYELNQGSHLILHVMGVALVFARLIHPLGFVGKKGISFGRFYGTLITWLCILLLAGLNIFTFINQAISTL